MIFVAETDDGRLVLFGKENNEYFYWEFFKNVEKPVIKKYGVERETLLMLLENRLDRYCKKGLNVALEKLDEV